MNRKIAIAVAALMLGAGPVWAQAPKAKAAPRPATQPNEVVRNQVSAAILAGNCEEAKRIAIAAGDLDLAEQALRLCAPLNAQPSAQSGTSSVGNSTLPAVANIESQIQAGVTAYSRQDFVTALSLFRPLADQGVPAAQFNLGVMYRLGLGVPQDYAQAVSWCRKAADQGYALAQYNLGVMYRDGLGVPQDYAQAVSWFRKAADQGYAYAQYNLGLMYRDGLGVPQDYAAAVSWYRKAAEQGDALGHNSLGSAYAAGEGVPRDYAQAVSWYRKGADQGEPYAQNNLGWMYRDGLGVPQDYAQAYKWHSLSASRATNAELRNVAAQNRDRSASKMTPAQLAEAQRLVSGWRPSTTTATNETYRPTPNTVAAPSANPYQKTCSDFGFRVGTEPFSECLLSLEVSQRQAEAQQQQYQLQQQQYQQQVAQQQKAAQDARDRQKWETIGRIGAGMSASRSPTFLGGLNDGFAFAAGIPIAPPTPPSPPVVRTLTIQTPNGNSTCRYNSTTRYMYCN